MALQEKFSLKKTNKAPILFEKFDLFEAKLCIAINRWGSRSDIKRFFCFISRLGDGVFWYILLGLFVTLNGLESLSEALNIGIIGIISVLIYTALKSVLARERPFISFGEITAHTSTLDKYSFPSGHSMNAACFTVCFVEYEPAFTSIVIPFSLLVAMSRVILGVHYISDVIVGVTLGGVIACAGLAIV